MLALPLCVKPEIAISRPTYWTFSIVLFVERCFYVMMEAESAFGRVLTEQEH
jgi:hypothetical protein